MRLFRIGDKVVSARARPRGGHRDPRGPRGRRHPRRGRPRSTASSGRSSASSRPSARSAEAAASASSASPSRTPTRSARPPSAHARRLRARAVAVRSASPSRRRGSASIFNMLLDTLADLRDYDVLVLLASDWRIKTIEKILGTEVVGITLGPSPLREDVDVDVAELDGPRRDLNIAGDSTRVGVGDGACARRPTSRGGGSHQGSRERLDRLVQARPRGRDRAARRAVPHPPRGHRRRPREGRPPASPSSTASGGVRHGRHRPVPARRRPQVLLPRRQEARRRASTRTPVVDGTGLKGPVEGSTVDYLQRECGLDLAGKKVPHDLGGRPLGDGRGAARRRLASWSSATCSTRIDVPVIIKRWGALTRARPPAHPDRRAAAVLGALSRPAPSRTRRPRRTRAWRRSTSGPTSSRATGST